jgi:hypothetical protein
MHPDWDPDKLATAAIFYNLHEADIAKGLLDSCGVDCFLCDEHMHRVHPLASDVIGGVRLQVWQKSCLKNTNRRKTPQVPGR